MKKVFLLLMFLSIFYKSNSTTFFEKLPNFLMVGSTVEKCLENYDKVVKIDYDYFNEFNFLKIESGSIYELEHSFDKNVRFLFLDMYIIDDSTILQNIYLTYLRNELINVEFLLFDYNFKIFGEIKSKSKVDAKLKRDSVYIFIDKKTTKKYNSSCLNFNYIIVENYIENKNDKSIINDRKDYITIRNKCKYVLYKRLMSYYK